MLVVVRQTRFVDPAAAARASIALLAAGAVLDAHRLIYTLSQEAAPVVMSDLPNPHLHLALRVATIVAFLLWVDCVWANLNALGERPERSRLAVLASFVVPPFCVYRPVQVVTELWSRTTRGDEIDVAMRDRFKARAVMWWSAVLVPPLLLLINAQRAAASAVEKMILLAAADAMNVTAALLAITIIYSITRRQRLLRAEQTPRSPAVVAANTPAGDAQTFVSAEPEPPAPVVIAPARRITGSAVPLRHAEHPVERLIRTQHARRRSLERSLGRVTARVWQFVLVIAAGAVVLSLAGSGFLLVQERASMAVGLIQIGFAAVTAAAATAVARQQTTEGQRGKWAALAAGGVTIALVQLLVIAESLGG